MKSTSHVRRYSTAAGVCLAAGLLTACAAGTGSTMERNAQSGQGPVMDTSSNPSAMGAPGSLRSAPNAADTSGTGAGSANN